MRDLSKKIIETPAVASNNAKEIGELCDEVLKFTSDSTLGVTFDDDKGVDVHDGGYHESKGEHADGYGPALASTQVSDGTIVDDAAARYGITDADDKAKFSAIYAQIADIDTELSPDQLLEFTQSALHQLAEHDESHHAIFDDTDEEVTKASLQDAIDLYDLSSRDSEMHAAMLSASRRRRLELYDSGATSMFRQRPVNAIPGTERLLAQKKSVSTADNGVVAERTYLETYNMMLSDKSAIVTIIVSPLVCPGMRQNMSVTSAHTLTELGVAHRSFSYNKKPQTLIVGDDDSISSIPLATRSNGLPFFELIDDDQIGKLVADGIPRINPDYTPYSQQFAMNKLAAFYRTRAAKSPHLVHVQQISTMCDEYLLGMSTGTPSTPLKFNCVEYEDIESVDVASYLEPGKLPLHNYSLANDIYSDNQLFALKPVSYTHLRAHET